MRTQAFGLLTCGVLVFGAALAACGASSGDDSSSPGSGNAAGTSSAAGTGSAAGGSTGFAGQGGGTPSGGGGATGFAGTGGGFAQSGTGGSLGTAGTGTGGASGGTSPGGTGAGGGSAGMTGSAGSGGGGTTIPALKFVVYLDDYTGSWATWANKIDFSKMTHMNLAFFTATTGNNWNESSGQSDSDIKALVAKAHAAGVKVIASLGGGGGDSSVVNQYKTPSNDDALVNNLDAMLNRLNLDGADMDIEKESKSEVGDNYGTLVSKIVAKLRPEGKLVTAAVAPYLQPYMNDDTLKLFDFVNVMTYSTNTGDYTSAAKFYTDKGLAKTKFTLGLISESDQHTSVATTKTITAMTKNYGGAMLWDLAEDASGSSSVYKAMQDSL